MAFANQVRKQVEKETGLSGIETSGHISKLWNAMSDAEKAKYTGVAAKQMLAWKKKFAAYKKTQKYRDFQAKKKAKSLGKKPKDKNAPKRPMSAYFLFTNDVRAQIQEELDTKDFGVIAKKVKEMWSNLSESEQAKYQAKAEKAKAKYAKTLETYKKSKKFAAYQLLVAEHKAKVKAAQKEEKEAAKEVKN